MTREQLKELGLTDEQINQVITLHGNGVEKHKKENTALTTERDGLKAQLVEANTAIEGFKKLDVDGIKRAADEWKTKAETATADAQKQLAQLRFDHALDGALAGAKAKDPREVKVHLNLDGLKFNEADGSIIGLNDQLEKVKTDRAHLFEAEKPDKPTPQFVAGGTNQSVNIDAVTAAARAAAGLPSPK